MADRWPHSDVASDPLSFADPGATPVDAIRRPGAPAPRRPDTLAVVRGIRADSGILGPPGGSGIGPTATYQFSRRFWHRADCDIPVLPAVRAAGGVRGKPHPFGMKELIRRDRDTPRRTDRLNRPQALRSGA